MLLITKLLNIVFMSFQTVKCRAKSLCSKLAHDELAVFCAAPTQSMKSNSTIIHKTETNVAPMPLVIPVSMVYVLIVS